MPEELKLLTEWKERLGLHDWTITLLTKCKMAFIVQKEKPTACDDCWFTQLKENCWKGTSDILCDIADEKHKDEFLDSTTVPNWCPLKKLYELKTKHDISRTHNGEYGYIDVLPL